MLQRENPLCLWVGLKVCPLKAAQTPPGGGTSKVAQAPVLMPAEAPGWLPISVAAAAWHAGLAPCECKASPAAVEVVTQPGGGQAGG